MEDKCRAFKVASISIKDMIAIVKQSIQFCSLQKLNFEKSTYSNINFVISNCKL